MSTLWDLLARQQPAHSLPRHRAASSLRSSLDPATVYAAFCLAGGSGIQGGTGGCREERSEGDGAGLETR